MACCCVNDATVLHVGQNTSAGMPNPKVEPGLGNRGKLKFTSSWVLHRLGAAYVALHGLCDAAWAVWRTIFVSHPFLYTSLSASGVR